MEVTKRTYQKHKTEKKISVKHYVIRDIHHDYDLGYQTYRIYVQVTYKRKNTKFKSKIPFSYLEKLPSVPVFNSFSNYEEYYIDNIKNNFECALTRDLNFIYWIVEQYINQRGEGFDISELPKIYHSNSFELSNFIESFLRKELLKALCSITGLDEPDGMSAYLKFPMSYNSPALFNLEFYLNKYPELIILKTKYSSNIWIFRMYEELGDSGNDFFRDAMFCIIEQSGYVISFPPTVFDYLTNVFQKRLLDSFPDLKSVNPIISDLNTLFLEYYDEYIKSVIAHRIGENPFMPMK